MKIIDYAQLLLLRIMKLTMLFLTICLLQVSAATRAQVNLKESNIPLQQALKAISRQTGYDFIYSDQDLAGAKPVTLNLVNATLETALQDCFENQPLVYVIQDKTVMVKKKEESYVDQLKDKLKAAMATVTVRGQVVDATNQPMAGVTAREKGTDNVTETDSKGYFSLTLINSDALVVFSFIGYETKELTTKDLPKGVVITLKVAENNLHEVVISKGYYDEKQMLSTGDLTVVSGKTIAQQPVSDPMIALEGQVPGLVVTQNSGLPGSNETIMLRGQSSIVNGNSPLFIIDGVPFTSSSLSPLGSALGSVNTLPRFTGQGGESPFSTLNMDDIENIEVLKDADATAIYGSRGANGVILITTKKGRPGNTKIDVDFSQGAGQVAHFMDMMNTQQYLQMRHEAFNMDGRPFPSITTNPNDNNYDVNGVWDTTRNTNWQKALIGGTAHYTRASVAISGGSENTQFYIGSNFTRNTTVFPGDFDDAKGSLNFSLTHSSADKRFQLTFAGGYTHDDNTLPGIDLTALALQLAPDAPALFNANGSLNWQLYNGTASWTNPLANLLQSAEQVTNNLTSNMQLSYRILPGLIAKASFGYTYTRLDQTNLTLAEYSAPPNNLIPDNRGNNFGDGLFSDWVIEPQVSYTHKISKGTLNVLAGATIQQNSNSSMSFSTSGYSSDALIVNPANASTFYFGGESNTLYRYDAIYARLGYTWDDKYLLNLTANRDGSSSFGPSKQYGNFGAAGAGWIFSKESFVSDNLSWLSYGKLRASYGITGNDQITPYQYLSSYSSNSSTYQGNPGLYPTRIPNPYYAWEVDKKLEFGLDLGFLKDRINFTADYFRNRSGNQLVGYTLPEISGFTSVEYNLPAIVQNSGYEFTLNTINIQSGGFKWATSFNLGQSNNKLIAFPGLATSSYSYSYEVGKPLSLGYGLTSVKVNPADGVYEFAGPTGETENPQFPGSYSFFEGPRQEWNGGLGNNFSYKGFQLDVFFQFMKQTAYSYWNTNSPAQAGQFNRNEPAALVGKTWTSAGDNAPYGRLSTQFASDPNFNLSSSNYGLGDASFIRLKNLALSYTLPKAWQQDMHLQSLSVYVQGENLFTITNYFGLDPETGNNVLPPLRMITLGIHATL